MSSRARISPRRAWLGSSLALGLSLIGAPPIQAGDPLLICSTNTDQITSGRPGTALKMETRGFLGAELTPGHRGMIVKRLDSSKAIVLYLARREASFSILENEDGVLRERVVGLWETGYVPHSLADINGDSLNELIVKRGGRLYAASFGPDGLTLPQRGAESIGNESYREKSRFVDIDGDGCEDLLSLIIGDSRRKTELRWRRSLGNRFEAGADLISPPDSLVDLIAVDWDGDGDKDLLGLHGRDRDSRSGAVWYWEATGKARYGEPKELFQFFPEDDRKQLHHFSELTVADMDGDGQLELLGWLWRSDKVVHELRVLARKADGVMLEERPEYRSKGAEVVMRGAILIPRSPRHPGPPPSPSELEAIWDQLGGDRKGAALALSRALQSDEALVPQLEKKLRGRAPVRLNLQAHIGALSSESREQREAAVLRLSSMGEPIEALLREAFKAESDPQARYLLWQLLDYIERQRSAESPLGMRRRRALQLIEALAPGSARESYQRLTDAPLTPDIQRHLRSALERLKPGLEAAESDKKTD